MAGTSKKRKSKMAKCNGRLHKPKRPKSAYNFFFSAERANILSEASSNGEAPPVFEDIGRIIGERWRNTEGGARVYYNKLAKTDNERYKNEMARFYKDQQVLMCRGLLPVSSPELTAAPIVAQPNRDSQVMDLSQQHQMPSTHAFRNGTMNNMVLANERSTCGGVTRKNPVLSTHLETTTSTNDDQVFQSLLQHKQSDALSAPNTGIMNLILTQKSSIQQQQQRLTEEINTLQLKDSLLDTMFATELSKLQRNTVVGNTTPFLSGGLGNADRQSLEHLSNLLLTQKAEVTKNCAALRSQAPTHVQHFSGSRVAPPVSSMQGLTNKQPTSPHFMPASSGMNCDPSCNNSNMPNNEVHYMSMGELIRMHDIMNGQ